MVISADRESDVHVNSCSTFFALWNRLDWYDKNQDKINKQCGIKETEVSDQSAHDVLTLHVVIVETEGVFASRPRQQ